jgi:hypothetical protein
VGIFFGDLSSKQVKGGDGMFSFRLFTVRMRAKGSGGKNEVPLFFSRNFHLDEREGNLKERMREKERNTWGSFRGGGMGEKHDERGEGIKASRMNGWEDWWDIGIGHRALGIQKRQQNICTDARGSHFSNRRVRK